MTDETPHSDFDRSSKFEIQGQTAEGFENERMLVEVCEPRAMEVYSRRIQAAISEIARLNSEKDNLLRNLSEVRSRLEVEDNEYAQTDPSVAGIAFQIEKARAKLVAAEANFPGDWTLLLQQRLTDPVMKKRFIEMKRKAMRTMKDGEPGKFDKAVHFKPHYAEQIDHYDENIEKVFRETNVGVAIEYKKADYNMGTGNIGKPGAVFDDALKSDRTPLSNRQKNIIESHEKGHGMRDFTTDAEYADFTGVLDTEYLNEKNEKAKLEGSEVRYDVTYLRQPVEIAERMSQLKNYFGFSNSRKFTEAHLDYAIKHYVSDTGLDNNMKAFLSAITPKVRAKFLEIINKYPI